MNEQRNATLSVEGPGPCRPPRRWPRPTPGAHHFQTCFHNVTVLVCVHDNYTVTLCDVILHIWEIYSKGMLCGPFSNFLSFTHTIALGIFPCWWYTSSTRSLIWKVPDDPKCIYSVFWQWSWCQCFATLNNATEDTVTRAGESFSRGGGGADFLDLRKGAAWLWWDAGRLPPTDTSGSQEGLFCHWRLLGESPCSSPRPPFLLRYFPFLITSRELFILDTDPFLVVFVENTFDQSVACFCTL